MGHKCEFPGCTMMATESSRFFRNFHCREHSHHLVEWPKERDDLAPPPLKAKRSGSNKYGKNYFKKSKISLA